MTPLRGIARLTTRLEIVRSAVFLVIIKLITMADSWDERDEGPQKVCWDIGF